MKIGVIGTFLKDHIISVDRKEVHSYGGIFYSVLAFANLLPENYQIYPVSYVGEDFYDEIIAELANYKNINNTYIQKIPQPNTCVKLIYKDIENRNEFLTNKFPPLSINYLSAIEPMDIWLVNFITGFEIALTDFIKFKEHTKSIICMDYHSLSLGITDDGLRFPRYLPEWQSWIENINILQMNEVEAGLLMNKTKFTEDDLNKLGKTILENNVDIINITLGSHGSIIFYENHKGFEYRKIAAIQPEKVVDVTGCGDAFMGGFLSKYIDNKDPLTAVHHANMVASANCQIHGASNLRNLRNLL